jgi:hypothetical protein
MNQARGPLGSGANSGQVRGSGIEAEPESCRKNRVPNLRRGFVIGAKLAEVELTFPDAMHKFDAGDRN